MLDLEIKKLSFHYPKHPTWILKDFALELEREEIIALLGDSGCGKSTLLRLVAGLEAPNEGEIFLRGQCMAGAHCFIEAEDRQVGMVFQDYALFPHMTVKQNLAFALPKCKRPEREERIQAVLAQVYLTEHQHKYPYELSGGQQQRVALSRSILQRPCLMLLDEPFSNLDASLRDELRQHLRELLKAHKISGILVTHEILDAEAVADRMVKMAPVPEALAAV